MQFYNQGTGSISYLYGLKVDNPLNTGGGSINNFYGIYVDTPTTPVNKWPLYIAGGNSYFGGNVGIGTTNPLRSLQIGPRLDAAFTFEPSDASPNAGYIRFGDQTGWKLHIGRNRESSLGPLNTGTTGVLMTIQDNGNVGIGTSSPQAKLQVAGDIQVAGNAVVTGNIAAKYQDVAEWVPARQ